MRIFPVAGAATLSMYMNLFCMAGEAAAQYESWGNLQVNIGGGINNGAPGQNAQISALSSPSVPFNSSAKWFVNYDPEATNCTSNPLGPNQCMSSGSGRLYISGSKTNSGDGTLLASKEFPFTNGISLEITLVPWCYNPALPGQAGVTNGANCFANVGLWLSEYNYRSIGFKQFDGKAYFNIWGPVCEVQFNEILMNQCFGTNNANLVRAYASVPMSPSQQAVLKVVYSKAGGVWRWDYFLNGNWVAGESAQAGPADYNQFQMGPGYFSSGTTRVVLAYGGIGQAYTGHAAQGWFEPVYVYPY